MLAEVRRGRGPCACPRPVWPSSAQSGITGTKPSSSARSPTAMAKWSPSRLLGARAIALIALPIDHPRATDLRGVIVPLRLLDARRDERHDMRRELRVDVLMRDDLQAGCATIVRKPLRRVDQLDRRTPSPRAPCARRMAFCIAETQAIAGRPCLVAGSSLRTLGLR